MMNIELNENVNTNVQMNKDIDPNLLIDMSETLTKDLGIPIFEQLFQNKTKFTEYLILGNLAKGGYGEVFLVERKKDKGVFACKRVAKTNAKKNINSTFFMNERNILLTGDNITTLRAVECFQDDTYIYYIMDYIPGGDLMGYLSRVESMNEDEIRFFAAEVAFALNKIHKAGYVHRDVKPDNILIKESGHLILGDFGTSGPLINGKVYAKLPVGTPDYVCIDLLINEAETKPGKKGFENMCCYDETVDFWGLGVIIYEMICGELPFYSTSLKETYRKIGDLDYPKLENGSAILKDLVYRLITKRKNRLDFEGIKRHPFFKGVKWDNLTGTLKPPFIPKVKHNRDINNFLDTQFKETNSNSKAGFKDFIGFTYDPECINRMNFMNRNFNGNSVGNEEKIDDLISMKLLEIDDLNITIDELLKEKEAHTTKNKKLIESIKLVNDELLLKKENLSQTKNVLKIQNSKLVELDATIKRKSDTILKEQALGSRKSLMSSELIKDMENLFLKSNFDEKLKEIEKLSHGLLIENRKLKEENEKYITEISKLKNENSFSNEDANEEMIELKKQLRILKTDVKDYEQRMNQEIDSRNQIEIKLSEIKLQANNFAIKKNGNSVLASKTIWNVTNGITNENFEIVFDNTFFYINNERYLKNLVYIRPFKNNEYHYFNYKKASLSVVIHLLNPHSAKSINESAIATRRSAKSIEEELVKEHNILKGLEKLMSILTEDTAKEVSIQITGSKNKISYLEMELNKAKKVTLTHERTNSILSDTSMEKRHSVYEYQNHLFTEKSVKRGTLCGHCNDLIVGLWCKAFCCTDCSYIVHNMCYLLVDYSCETKKEIDRGITMVVLCKNLEERENLLASGSI